MSSKEYSIEVKPQSKTIEVTFASAVTFDMVEDVLNQVRGYVAENYQIRIMGYVNMESNYLKAFMLGLSLFGNEDRIVFENKAKFRRAERRLIREQVQELRDKGYSAKEMSEKSNIPLKTIYRWLRE